MKPVFTKEGKETVKNFIMNLVALQKELIDVKKIYIEDVESLTEEDVLQDILFFEEDFENAVELLGLNGTIDIYTEKNILKHCLIDYKEKTYHR